MRRLKIGEMPDADRKQPIIGLLITDQRNTNLKVSFKYTVRVVIVATGLNFCKISVKLRAVDR